MTRGQKTGVIGGASDMRHAKQESESIELAVLLSLAGGLMDCYS